MKFLYKFIEMESHFHLGKYHEHVCIVGGSLLTHWARVTHICVDNLTIIGSDNGLSPGRRQAIIRTIAGILLIRPLGTNFSEFLVKILIFSFKKMCLKVSSAKRRPFCLGLNELNLIEKEEFRVTFFTYTSKECRHVVLCWHFLWAIKSIFPKHQLLSAITIFLPL